MSLIYTGRIDKLEIGLNAGNNVDITNVVLMNWERIHDIRPRLTANTKVPVGWQQPHSWIIGSFSLLSNNDTALYATAVDALGNFALDANGDSATIGFFMVTYRDSNNNVMTTTFNNAIISRPVKELLNYDDSVWIYNFLAYFADDA
jgi:hypothetical protein